MRFTPPKLYAITDVRLSGLTHLEQVKRLIEGGATLIQLREKNAAPRDWFDDALDCSQYARERGATLIVNDRIDIAMAIRADGVHLGQEDMPVEAARNLLGTDAIIGLSTHTLAQVESALSLPVDYIGFGPIFATTTKSKPDNVVGLELLRKAKQIAGDLPIVAIGGVTLANAPEVLADGPTCVAIISGLISQPSEIATRIRRLS